MSKNNNDICTTSDAINVIAMACYKAGRQGCAVRVQIYSKGMFNMYMHVSEAIEDLASGVYGSMKYITEKYEDGIIKINMDELA